MIKINAKERGNERPTPSRPPTATDSGSMARVQTALRSGSQTPRSIQKGLMSIEEEAEAAAQADSEEQSGTLGSQSLT